MARKYFFKKINMKNLINNLDYLSPEIIIELLPEPYEGIIESVRGKGKLMGTGFADTFTFDSFDVFTKKAAGACQISDFP